VRFLQLWNEPNLAYEWNWQRPNPQQFVDLLRLASTAARAANPDAVILFPSLAPTDGLDPSAPFSDLEYLDAVYKAGGAAYFDIMSAQAYGLGQPPEEHRYVRVREDRNWRRPLDTRIDVSRLPLLREVMERHGDNGKAVWISEFGYVSASDTIPPERRNAWGVPVSEDQKAEYIVGQIERARREWPWVGVMNVWLLRWGGYQEADPADPTPNFALVDREFNPLPAYTKLKAFLANPAIAGVGAHSWEHPALQQGSDGMTLLRFEGTTLSLVGAGEVRINLAGGEQQRVTLAETPQVVLRGLADNTVHTVAIDAKGAQPTAFVVSRTQSNAWVWTLVPAVLLLTLACTGAMIARNLWITRG
jgi:hypothetical protein